MRGAFVVAAALLFAAAPAVAATYRVTSSLDEGKGTLRAAIDSANANPGSTIRVLLGHDAEIFVERALPPVTAKGTKLNGGGVTLREAAGCMRPNHKKGCDGLVVSGPGILVRDLAVAGFLFDGVAVRGSSSADVVLESIVSIDNLDDGVGVSNGAGPVLVRDCLLMGNGFRTKGKGLLVFDHSTATLRDSLVIGNRDGVTVTDGSLATLERVLVSANYDKGVGVSGASVVGREVAILGSGRDAERLEDVPNGDGLRVGLGGSADLADCLVAGSEDTGVVALDTSSVTLKDCVIEGNRGRPSEVAPTARLVQE